MKEALVYLAIAVSSFAQSGAKLIDTPRIWNDRDLSDWATPVAGLNVRPSHFSEKEYYSAPVGEFVRTYPVYFPGREPAGYWEMLRNAKPEPLIKPGARTMSDWVKDGDRVFHELDIAYLRSYDPKWLEILRSADEYKKLRGTPRADGTVYGLRWVPTSKGLALGVEDCVGCHSRLMPDGRILDGPPRNEPGDGVFVALAGSASAVENLYAPGDPPGGSSPRTSWMPGKRRTTSPGDCGGNER